MKVPYTYWKDGDYFIGYINEYPDYETQGTSESELVDNLKDIYHDLAAGLVPGVRHQIQAVLDI